MTLPKKPPQWALDRIRSRLSYDPSTGRITWINDVARSVKEGDWAGTKNAGNRRTIHLVMRGDSVRVREANVAYFLMTGDWPTFEIDHKDRDCSNNKWDNLRPATRHQQMHNRGRMANNKSGYTGVYLRGQKYYALIFINGALKRLGTFPTKEEAAIAYQKAAASRDAQFYPS